MFKFDMYSKPIRVTNLLNEVKDSNKLYYDSVPNTSLSKAKKLRDLGVDSVENLTDEQIINLSNKKSFKKRYIPKESLDKMLELENSPFVLCELSKYKGVIPESILDSIKEELNGVFSYYKHSNVTGKYEIYDGHVDHRHFIFNDITNKPNIISKRVDFILVNREKVGFEDFKNNKDVNKCEQALYLTELKGGYRIVESW